MKSNRICPEIPTILIVLGATGDLMKKKIIPAVYHLYICKRLPHCFRVVGVARRNIKNNDFQTYVRNELQNNLSSVDQKISEKVAALFTYHQGQFQDKETFERLKIKLNKQDIQWKSCSNKLFYMAVSPEHFEPIFQNMVNVGLNTPCSGTLGWTRLLIEKPFGKDKQSAKKLFKLLNKYFEEKQLYLIDHYLAKNIIQAIMYFRFSNNLFEKSWNNNSIECIDVRLLETGGVEGRGSFYDAIGAFRDVGQNHLIQMLTAITMNSPMTMLAANFRRQRAETIESLKKWNIADIRKQTFRAQYDGYRSIPEVSSDSTTETYFKLQTELTMPAWKGVPIFLESGKRCTFARKEVVVTFKHPTICVACAPGVQNKNRVVFEIEPEERISIHFLTKKTGFEQELEERSFDFFLHKHAEKMQYVEEYAELIFNCLIGNQTMFVSEREIMAQWEFTDPIISAWKDNLVPLNHYSPETEEMMKASAYVVESRSTKKMSKEIAIIGLGKMGSNMALHMIDQGWLVTGFNRSHDVIKELAGKGLVPAYSLEELAKSLSGRKIIWLMLPAGDTIDEILFGNEGLIKYLNKGDIIIDGGNSFYKDTIRREKKLAVHGIYFIDCGISGGPNGARYGASLMIGGKRKNFEAIEELFRDFALPEGYQFFEGIGAGHFVKMIHNGIEYGMMQAIAEGFTILKNSKYKLDLSSVCDVYNHGSVIESRLIGWLKKAFKLHGESLKAVLGTIEQSGEGKWTVETAREMNIVAKVIHEALLFRLRSQKSPSYTGQIVSALREQFGGHSVLNKEK